MAADLDRLSELLDEWEHHWRRLGLPIAGHAQPGAGDEEIAAAEARTGLILPVEARAWFHWHNGDDAPYWNIGMRAAPRWRLVSVARAAEVYIHDRANLPPREQLGGLDPDIFFPPQYFPLAKGGGVLVVDTSGDPSHPAAVDIVDPHHEHPSWPLDPIFPSVTDCVELIVRGFREGWIYFNEEHGILDTRHAEIPRQLRSPIW